MPLDLADNPATNAAREVLGKKYGPLPLWVWLIVVGGTVYGVRRVMTVRSASQAAEDAADAATVNTNSLTGGKTGLVTPRTDQSLFGGGTLTGASSGGTVAAGEPPTNQQWLQRAVSLMTNQGTGWDGYRIQTALQRFINGMSITDPTDRAIVSQALGTPAIGAPPSNPTPAEGTGFDVDSAGQYLPDVEAVRIIQGRVDPDFGRAEYKPGTGQLTLRSNGGMYVQYSDGTVRSLSTPTEVFNIIKSNPALRDEDGNPRVTTLTANDPIWKRVSEGWGITQHKSERVMSDPTLM